MKYLMMVQGTQADYEAMSGKPSAHSPAAWSKEDVQAMYAFMQSVNDDLAQSGELLDGNGLTEPAQTRFVSVGDGGQPMITDSPYKETTELLAGYWLLNCESLERATEIALRVAKCPQPEGAPDYPVVIRPVMEDGGEA